MEYSSLSLQVVLTIVVVAIGVSWKFAALMLLILIVHAFVSYRASEQYERQAMNANTAAGTLSGALGDLLRNAQRAVFNGQGEHEIEQVGQVASDKNVSDFRMAMLLVKACALQFGVIGFGIGVLLVLGALDVLNGAITTGDFVMLQTYVLSFAAPVASYGYVLRQAGIAAENVDDALNYMVDDIGSHDNEITLAISTTAVPVSGCYLNFSYNGRPAISDLNVEVPAGVFAVVVGPNGSGKSTLAKLLAGLLKPDNGMIKIGDNNPSDFQVMDHAMFFISRNKYPCSIDPYKKMRYIPLLHYKRMSLGTFSLNSPFMMMNVLLTLIYMSGSKVAVFPEDNCRSLKWPVSVRLTFRQLFSMKRPLLSTHAVKKQLSNFCVITEEGSQLS